MKTNVAKNSTNTNGITEWKNYKFINNINCKVSFREAYGIQIAYIAAYISTSFKTKENTATTKYPAYIDVIKKRKEIRKLFLAHLVFRNFYSSFDKSYLS